jgi:hypothetical protein
MSFTSEWKQRKKKLIAWIKTDFNGIHTTIAGISIIVISIILANFIPQTAVAKENIQQNEIIKKMAEIDNIAHQYDKIIHNLEGSGYNEKRDRMFHVKDNNYHKAQYRDEKYTAAIELNDLIIEQNTFIHKMIQENPFSKAEKDKFDQLQKELKQLQQK